MKNSKAYTKKAGRSYRLVDEDEYSEQQQREEVRRDRSRARQDKSKRLAYELGTDL